MSSSQEMQNMAVHQTIHENVAVEKYFVTRQLPSLETISNPIEDEHVRNKLSTMSFKEHHPLLKRIIDPAEQQQQRRHSIANIIEPEYKYSAHYPIPYSAPSTPPYHQHQSSPHYFYAKDPMRRNSMATMATGRRDSSNRITALILSEDENNISRRASTSSISSSSSSLHEGTPKGRYARSPELRASHKLAERKRRQEMKELFDELRKALPVDKSLKTSKWEILSKSIDYIGALRHRVYVKENEVAQLKQEIEELKRRRS
ncbi:Putative BHLH transcription factor-like protein (Fragment) [Rhizopus microsporus]